MMKKNSLKTLHLAISTLFFIGCNTYYTTEPLCNNANKEFPDELAGTYQVTLQGDLPSYIQHQQFTIVAEDGLFKSLNDIKTIDGQNKRLEFSVCKIGNTLIHEQRVENQNLYEQTALQIHDSGITVRPLMFDPTSLAKANIPYSSQRGEDRETEISDSDAASVEIKPETMTFIINNTGYSSEEILEHASMNSTSLFFDN